MRNTADSWELSISIVPFMSPEEDGVSGFISIIRIVVYSILVYLIIIGLTVVHIIVRIFIMLVIIGEDIIILCTILRHIG